MSGLEIVRSEVIGVKSLVYPSLAVANEFIVRSDFTISPMKVQKLVYFAHAWCLRLTGKPLIDDSVEAWTYGPVIDSIYMAFKKYGNKEIKELACDYTGTPFRIATTEKYTLELIDQIWRKYGSYSAIQLSQLTHQSGSPWSIVYDNGTGKGLVISNAIIQQHFIPNVT